MAVFGPQVGAAVHLLNVIISQLYLVGRVKKHLVEGVAYLFLALGQV